MSLINVVHPKLPPAKSSLQSKEAFDKVLKAKGWIEITAEQAVTHNAAITAGETSPLFANTAKKGGDK